MSVRQLHRLFAATGETVTRRIRRLRLERCRHDLADRRLATESVTDISRRWGVRRLPRFSRAFRAAYGPSPRLPSCVRFPSAALRAG